ncbi:MAG: hypothetical protein ACK4V6_00390 [Microthrixaceae bacterium]
MSLAVGLSAATIVAHQGGWDEMLMVAVPVAAFAGLLYAANKRATKLADRDEQPAIRRPEPRNERGGPI